MPDGKLNVGVGEAESGEGGKRANASKSETRGSVREIGRVEAKEREMLTKVITRVIARK